MFRGCNTFFKNKTREIGLDVIHEATARLPQKIVKLRERDLGIPSETTRKSKKPEAKLEKFDWSGYKFSPITGGLYKFIPDPDVTVTSKSKSKPPMK